LGELWPEGEKKGMKKTERKSKGNLGRSITGERCKQIMGTFIERRGALKKGEKKQGAEM